MIKCMGFGGLGDCFICALKCLELNDVVHYTHIDHHKKRLGMEHELLNYLGLDHECILVDDIKRWWHTNYKNFDKLFNVFAEGRITIPRRPYHWQPCVDDGYKKPFFSTINKVPLTVVQVGTGGKRTWKHKPVIQYVLKNYNPDTVIWIGKDNEFDEEFKYSVDEGLNMCNKTTLAEALTLVSVSQNFVGFNSLFLYWALYNRTNSFLFTDHQGKKDLRIHKEWKNYLTYDIDKGI